MLNLRNKKNTRKQGLVGLSSAIDWFVRNEYNVSIPLDDSQAYDLIVERDNKLFRVQVKTTYCKVKYNIYKVQLETAGGNQSFYTRKKFDNTICELLFILTDDNEQYLIPTNEVQATRSINLGKDKLKYKLIPI